MHGQKKGFNTKGVWSLDKQNVALVGQTLTIKCGYNAIELEERLVLDNVEVAEFKKVLNHPDVNNIFLLANPMLKMLLKTKYGIDLGVLRRCVINNLIVTDFRQQRKQTSFQQQWNASITNAAQRCHHTVEGKTTKNVVNENYLDEKLKKN